MALEALTNAISQAGRDYMAYKREDERVALEDKRYARDRADKLADEQRAMENQKTWFNYTNQQGMEYEMQKIRAMSAEQKRQVAMELGINPNQPEAQLGEAIFQAQLARSARTAEAGALAQAQAELKARESTLPQREALDDKEKAKDRWYVEEQYTYLNDELRKALANTGGVVDDNEYLNQIAPAKLQSVLGNPDNAKKFLAENGVATIEDQTRFGQMSPGEQAAKLNLFDQNDLALAKQWAARQMSSRLEGTAATIAAQRIRDLDTYSMQKGLRVTPTTSAWFSPQPKTAPVTTPKTTPKKPEADFSQTPFFSAIQDAQARSAQGQQSRLASEIAAEEALLAEVEKNASPTKTSYSNAGTPFWGAPTPTRVSKSADELKREAGEYLTKRSALEEKKRRLASFSTPATGATAASFFSSPAPVAATPQPFDSGAYWATPFEY